MNKIVSTIDDYLNCNQQHILEHIQNLPDVEKQKFWNKLQQIDIRSLYDTYLKYKENIQENLSDIEPIENKFNEKRVQEYYDKGLKLIQEGKLAIVMMAGGQGTRLGFPKPKGMYDIGLPMHKSLFQIYCERIQSLQNLVKAQRGSCLPIYFYIMTSEDNHEDTTQFFIAHKYFGLQEDQIVFFQQDSLPILSIDGKIQLTSPTTLLSGPDGNGRVFGSLYSQGHIELMKVIGIQYIHICAVDNILCKLADPLWAGYVDVEQLIISSKFVRKTRPDEKVGIHCKINGKIRIREYSEMTKEDCQKTDSQGRLIYSEGNICQLICSVDFVEMISAQPLIKQMVSHQYHVAEKKYAYYDPFQKKLIHPEQNNSLKFELLYFDVFSLCPTQNFGLFEAIREDEFAPVKNAPGQVDSADTARALYMNRDRKWLKKQGFTIQQDLEISQKLTYFGEGLEKYQQHIKQIMHHNPLILSHQSEQTVKAQKSLTNIEKAEPQYISLNPQIRNQGLRQSTQGQKPLTFVNQSAFQKPPSISISVPIVQSQPQSVVNGHQNAQFFQPAQRKVPTIALNQVSPRQSAVILIDQKPLIQHSVSPNRKTTYGARNLSPYPIPATRATVYTTPRPSLPPPQNQRYPPYH
ncbi:hypothetical protein pb186bvf_008641 [Paramecium bursaria]